MSILIRFVMIKQTPLESEFNLKTYTSDTLNKVMQSLNANNLVSYPSDTNKTADYSLEIENTQYCISFTAVNTSRSSQLRVDISKVFINSLDKELHKLKLAIKNEMINSWDECLWLEDQQSEAFAEELYRNAHSVENALRRLINTILFHQLGGDWWEMYMPTKLTSKYDQRHNPYKERAPSFRDVHTNLMSIDTGDLVKILTFKTFKVKKYNLFNKPISLKNSDTQINNKQVLMDTPQRFQYIMSDILNEPTNKQKAINSHQGELIQVLTEQMEVDLDFWENFFSPWFSCELVEFEGQWRNFSTDRNHVAHNKLIDLKLYQRYKKTMENLFNLIKEAEQKFSNHLNSEMDIFVEKLEERELMQKINDYKIQLDFRKKISEESGVEILDEEEILDKFQELVTTVFDNIKEEIYFRSDIEVTLIKPTFNKNEKIFKIIHSYFDNKIHVDGEVLIDSSEGGTSNVILRLYYNDGLEETFPISITNGEAEFNEDQSSYLPITQEEYDFSSLNDLETMIYDLVDDYMPEIEEDEIACFPCEECGKFTINIAEYNEFSVGTCLYCKHMNSVGQCTRCGEIIDSDEDLLCYGCECNIIEN